MKPRRHRSAVPLLAALVVAAPSAAQCPLFWGAGGPESVLTGNGRCSVLWDPDGSGPSPVRLVVGGSGLAAGTAATGQRVMTWDGSRWDSLGTGPITTGSVARLAVWNGQLVASGGDIFAGVSAFLQVWNGVVWQPLPPGFPSQVRCLCEWNGNLVVAGETINQGIAIPDLKLWNGVSWSTLPAPPLLQSPGALISYQGLLCVGGLRTSPTQGIVERWNGSSWAISIFASERINTFAVRASTILGGTDSLFAGGQFDTIGVTAAARVAGTSGGPSFSWSGIGSAWPLPTNCSQLHVRSTSQFFATVVALTYGSGANVVQSVSGGAWTAMGSANLTSVVYFGGAYHGTQAGSASVPALLRFDGSAWIPVRGPGLDAGVRAATASGDDVILGGTFSTSGALALGRVARWDGTTFHPLGTGITGTSVDALATMADGGVVAGGSFTAAGGVAANHVARWSGSAWSALGTGMDQQVLALVTMPNGDLVAGGRFTTAGGVACSRIARWNGTTWSPLGTGMDGDVHALAVRADGRLFAGGSFTNAGGAPCNHVAQWTGASWLQVGAGTNGDVLGLTVRANADVVAVGAFTTAGGAAANRCARWSGTAWASMGTASADPSPVRSAIALPNGDVLVGHGFHTPTNNPDEGIARWNGSAWSGVGSGLGNDLGPLVVQAFALRRSGDLIVGGDFRTADGFAARNLARLAPSCPAAATPYGAGCSSAAGLLAITADTLPWLGASFRTTTTGAAANSLCLGVIGFTPVAIPLPSLLAEGQAGCSLLAAPDITFVLTNGPGTAHSSFALANAPSLLGAAFFQQTVPLEFGGTGALVAVRGSNALAATIGTL